MKKNIYSRSLLLLSFFIFNGCLLLGQKVSDKQEDSVTPYPLGTTWYYHSSEKTGMDSPMHYGYIRHRVEKDVQIGEYKAQEVQTIHVDRLGVETALEPYYLYRKGFLRHSQLCQNPFRALCECPSICEGTQRKRDTLKTRLG